MLLATLNEWSGVRKNKALLLISRASRRSPVASTLHEKLLLGLKRITQRCYTPWKAAIAFKRKVERKVQSSYTPKGILVILTSSFA